MNIRLFAGFVVLLFFSMSGHAQDADPAADWPFDVDLRVDHDMLVTGQSTVVRWTFTRGLTEAASCTLYASPPGGPLLELYTPNVLYKNGSRRVTMDGAETIYLALRCTAKTAVDAAGAPMVIGFHRNIEWVDSAQLQADVPVCFPKPIGSGTWPERRPVNVGTADVGECAAWWCSTDAGDQPEGVCWHWRDLEPVRTVAWLLGLNDSSAASEWTGFEGWETLSIDERAAMIEAAEASRPSYVVKASSFYPDRPTYPRRADGTRSTSSNGRVAIGAPCDCTSSIGSYCDVSAGNLDARTGAPLPTINEDGTGGAFSVCVLK